MPLDLFYSEYLFRHFRTHIKDAIMRDPMEVLKAKEMEMIRVRKEIDALKIAARLLGDEPRANGDHRDDKKSVVEMP
jgi:hypothetical protein